jgi:outer membrane protein assembly factor BamB
VWAERDYGPSKRRHNPHSTPPRTEPVVDWQHAFDAPLDDGWFIVADDTVYVATRRQLLALDTADGRTRWKRRIDGPAGLKYVDGRLYQLNWRLRESDLVARSLSGDERWRTTIPSQLRGLHEQNGYVFVAGRDRYWTLHADTGTIVRARDDWVRNMAFDGDALYAAFSGTLVRYEIEGRTLQAQWQTKVDYPTQSGQPVVAEDVIYVPQYNPGRNTGGVLVSGTAGENQHRISLQRSPRRVTMTEDGTGVVVTLTKGQGLRAIQPDGDQQWTADVRGRSSAIAANGAVFAGDPLIALDDKSGEQLWTLDVDGVAQLAAAESTLYVAQYDRLIAFRE